jgi:hypothetical protein
VEASSRSPDVAAINRDGEITYIKLEYKSPDFILHGRPKGGCDYIVCWKDDLEEKPHEFPKIISNSSQNSVS